MRNDKVKVAAKIISAKEVRALRGYFAPLYSQKLKNNIHQCLLIGLLEK